MPLLLVLLILLGLPLLEVIALLWLGRWLGHGVWWYLLLSALMGAWLCRREWLRLRRVATRPGTPPLERLVQLDLLRTGRVLLAGALLVLPGMISDGAAVLLLLRRPATKPDAASDPGEEPMPGQPTGATRDHAPSHPGHILEGEFHRVDEPTPQRPPDGSESSRTQA